MTDDTLKGVLIGGVIIGAGALIYFLTKKSPQPIGKYIGDPLTASFNLINLTSNPMTVWVGWTNFLGGRNTPTYFDVPPKQESLNANETKPVIYETIIPQTPLGVYYAYLVVWDVKPEGDCEAQGTCHRISEGVWVDNAFKIIG